MAEEKPFLSGITAETARELLSYESETGELTWRARSREWFNTERSWRSWNARFSGKPAFTAVLRGYLYGSILGRTYSAHRVAWLMRHGKWPSGQIDHINHDRSDNRLANLRDTTSAGNALNQSRRNDNTSGATGVSRIERTGKWMAHIRVHGKSINLGHYSDIEAAISARAAASIKHGFHDNHGAS